MKSVFESYFNAITMRRTHENFWHNFFTFVVYGGRLHHDCCGPKHQKHERVHVKQRSEVAVFDGTGDNNDK